MKATTACVRRPARGLVTLRSASGDTTERGMKALLEISAEGDLTICGGANFDEQLLKVAVCKISVHFYEESAFCSESTSSRRSIRVLLCEGRKHVACHISPPRRDSIQSRRRSD